MNSPFILAGPEAAPTLQTSQFVTFRSLSPGSTTSIIVFLSLSGLAALVFTFYWTRRRRRTPKVVDEQPPGETAVAQDVEALAAARLIVPVAPLQNVRWTPQIRSISGPTSEQSSDRKLSALPPRRARSPPPLISTRNSFPDSYAKSAPAHALSFSQINTMRPPKRWDVSPSVTPRTLAVSGMQTRTLGRPGEVGSKD